MILRFFVPLWINQVPGPEKLEVNAEFLEAQFSTIDPEVVRQTTGLKSSAARRVFASFVNKINQIKGTPESRTINGDEASLLRYLVGNITIKPAFDLMIVRS